MVGFVNEIGAEIRMALEKLAINLDRNDEIPNIELAEYLVEKEDVEGIFEVIQGLKMDRGIANDCIKVIYEIGERKPLLIADYVSVFAKLCKYNKQYEKEVLPFLIKHLETCRPKEVAQHAERIVICIHKDNKEMFVNALVKRKLHLSDAQSKRVDKLLKKLQGDK